MNKKNLPSEIYEILRSRILGFKLLPGIKISDKDIAKELGVSRTPVREALIRLVNQGLVTSLHNRGFTVREFSIKDVEDIYSLREALEILAVKLAIKRLDAQKIEEINALTREYPQLLKSGDRNDFNKADENFHLLIAGHSDNAPLKAQLISIHDQLAVLRRYAYMLSQGWRDTYEKETYEQHMEVLKHMMNRDEQKTVDAMSRHIKDSMDSVINALKQSLE